MAWQNFVVPVVIFLIGYYFVASWIGLVGSTLVTAAFAIGLVVIVAAIGWIKIPFFKLKKEYLALIGLALIIGSLYSAGRLSGLIGSVTGAASGGAKGVEEQPGVVCGVNPSVVLTVTDALQPGTAVTASGQYRINGVYTGYTSPTVKGTADVVLNASTYLNALLTGKSITCGSNQIAATMYAVANATESIYDNSGINILTNAAGGGAHNETVMSASGGQYNWRLHMVGVDKKSTGTMLLIVDLTAPSANVSSVSLSSITGSPAPTPVAVPSGYSSQTSGGYSAAFLIPAVTGASTADYNLQVQAKTGYYVTSAVYTSTYSLQPFVDSDGTFNVGSTAWNSLGAAKYNTYQTYNFLIK